MGLYAYIQPPNHPTCLVNMPQNTVSEKKTTRSLCWVNADNPQTLFRQPPTSVPPYLRSLARSRAARAPRPRLWFALAFRRLDADVLEALLVRHRQHNGLAGRDPVTTKG